MPDQTIPTHPLATLFPNAACFYLPDGTPGAVLHATYDGNSQRDPGVWIGFSMALDARGRRDCAKLKQPIFKTESALNVIDGSPAKFGRRYDTFHNWQTRPIDGKGARYSEWRDASKGGATNALRHDVIQSAGTLPPPLISAILDTIAGPSLDYKRERASTEAEEVARLEALSERSEWDDKILKSYTRYLASTQEDIAEILAFLATVAPWRQAHGAAPDPEAASRAAAAAQAHAEARAEAERTREATEQRAAERARLRALAEARTARLHEASEGMLALLKLIVPFRAVFEHSIGPIAADAEALIARVEGVS